MVKKLLTYLGSGMAAAAALLVGGRIALADPPAVAPRAPDTVRETPRQAARDTIRENRETVRDARIDRRIRRAPGELGIRLGAIADRGLAIANVVTNGVLYNAGLRPGDYIISVNGHRLAAQADFDRYLYADGADQPVKVVVWRDGREVAFTLQPNVLYTDNTADTAYDYNTDLRYFGVDFDPQYTDRLVIRRVLPNSRAYLAGLRDGDEITTWHGERIRSPRQFARAIHDAKPGVVDFEYNRGSKTMRAQANFDRREERTTLKPVLPPDSRTPATSGREPGRDAIPKVTPPTGREPIPTVTPPAGREPIPTVTPPTGREPPKATPPATREPPKATPPATREPPKATPPAGREPPKATPPAVNPPRPAEPSGTPPREK